MTYLKHYLDINIIDFKTSNIWYTDTTCPIDFKLTGFNMWAIRSIYTNFQAIIKFYKTLKFLILGAIDTFYGPVSIQIN